MQNLLIPENNNVRMKLQTLQILHIFIECKIMVGGASVHISKHFTFSSQDHGRLSIVHCVVWCGMCCVYEYMHVHVHVHVCVDMVVRM